MKISLDPPGQLRGQIPDAFRPLILADDRFIQVLGILLDECLHVTVPKPAPFPGCGELRSKAIAFVFQLGYRGYGVAHRKLEVILRALAAGGVSDVLPRGFRRRVFHVHHAESVVEIRQFISDGK